jgi:TolB-like protein/Flp pilus assembly protein TadD
MIAVVAAAVAFFILMFIYVRKDRVWLPQSRTVPSIDSMAVLPFATNDPAVEYLGDGIAYSIRYRLSALPNMKVISSSSVLRYKGKQEQPHDIGQELNVRAVLTGRFYKNDDDVLLEVELADTNDNSLLWGQQYRGKFSNLAGIQEQASEAITEKLRPQAKTEATAARGRYTGNPNAYEAYLRGQFYRAKFTPEAMNKAIGEFQSAIRLDPNFADAYAQEGMAYWLLAQPLAALPAKEGMPKAKAAALKALELDDKVAMAHSVLGWTASFYDWDFSTAEQEFKRAINLNSNDALAHLGYAFLLSSLGHHERGIAEGKKAVEVAPLDLSVRIGLSEQYQLAHQFDAAVRECNETIKIDPEFGRAFWNLSWNYKYSGDYDQAITALQKSMLLERASRDEVAELGRVYRRGGINGVRRWSLKDLESGPAFMIGSIHAELGERDQAIEYIRKAYENREGSLLMLDVWPSFDAMHSDPRYQEFVRRMGLPQ